jgi:uncharacterized membrane protein YfcA
MTLTALAAILVGGFLAGVVNTLAGGGSLLTLPLLIFCGQSPILANGTNRVAILAQGIAATFGFRAGGVDMLGAGLKLALPMMLGSVAGALLALWLGDAGFETALAWVLLSMAAVVLVAPQRWMRASERQGPLQRAGLWLSMVLLGAYAGFVQAGVGVLMLAALVGLGGHDLVRANAVKVIVVAAATVVSLSIFWWHGQVDWAVGAVLAVGMGAGGWAGARLQLKRGAVWVRIAVALAVTAAALKLLGVIPRLS